MCAVANGLSGFVASVSAGAFYLDYTALVRPILQRREICGEFHTLVQELRKKDPDAHRRYFRMGVEDFDEILQRVEPRIAKKSTHFRDPIPPAERLAATLRYDIDLAI